MSQVSYGSITITDATDGVQSAIVYLYRNSDEGTDAAPSVPSNELTYTFSTGRLSGTLNGWQQNTSGLDTSRTIWLITAMALSSDTTDDIQSSEWSQPRPFSQTAGQDGQDGLNQATVFIYKRGTEATKPTTHPTYTFSDGSFTPPTGWSKTIPTANGNPCFVTAAVAIGNGATATLGEWADITILAQDGFSPIVSKTGDTVTITAINDTVTISDGTSYYTHIRYSANSTGANYKEKPDNTTTYIGVYTGTSSTAPAYNDSGWTWSKYVGSPGAQGVSVTNVKEVYYHTTGSAPAQSTLPNGAPITSTSTGLNTWTTVVPTYVTGGKYYTSLQTTLSAGTSPIFSPIVLNQGLTDSNYNAALAKAMAQSSEENSIGALSIARGVRQHFFWFPTDVSDKVPAGSYIAEENEDTFKAGPTKGNLLTRSDGVWIRDGAKTLAALQGDALTFFVPDGNLQGKPGIQLTNSALNFYRPGTNTVDATLDSNGLVLSKGGVTAGSPSTNNFVYLNSEPYGTTYNINGSSNVSDWKEIIGTKFGVRADGTLYANGAIITGKIEASSGSNILTSVSSKDQYYLSTSSSSATGGSWSDTVPTWSSGKYIWTRVATTKTTPDGSTTTYSTAIYDSALTSALSTATSAQGLANGAASTVTTTKEYNLSSSTSTANGTWSTTVPTWSNNKYIWIRLKIVKKTVGGTTTTSYTPSEAGSYDSALTTALSTAAEAKITAGNAAPNSSAIAEEQRIYYRSNSNTKPNGNGLPTAWVTETGNKYNTNATTAAGWSRKITPISTGTSDTTKYLYLWTCIQRKTVSGTITYGDILLDDSTTVIDGGKIITGSIDANKINVTDLNAFSATIGGFVIDSTSIHTNGVAITSNADNSIGLSTADFTRTISSTSRGGLRFALGDKFGITGDGTIYAGGWIMGASSIYKSSASATAVNQVQVQAGMQGVNGLPTDSTTLAFYVCRRTCTAYSNNTPTYGSWSYPFRVNYDGSLTATKATITGNITATSGTIGSHSTAGSRWQIGSTSIYNGTNSMTSTTVGTYLGVDGIRNYKDANTYVNIKDGKITAVGADIKGKITATSGSFDSVSATNFTFTSGNIAGAVKIGGSSGTAASTVVSNASTAKSKSDCITIIDTSGIWVTPTGSKPTNTSTGAGATGTRINSGGMQVYVGGSQVASYGTDARIGKSNTRHIEIKSGGLQVYQDSSVIMAHIGYASGNAEESGVKEDAPYFVFGSLNGTPTLGNYSLTEGVNNMANGFASHAEGRSTTAEARYSHTEGKGTTANGNGAHAEGCGTTAHGKFSHAEGLATTANGVGQTVIGRNNIPDSTSLFIVGVGEAEIGNYLDGLIVGYQYNAFRITTEWSTQHMRDIGKILINEEPLADFVTEQGNGYRKWNSGLAECWVHTAQNVALNNAYGSLYQGTWTWKFPITFNANPAVTCSHFKWGTGGSWGTIGGVSTTAATLRGFDTYSRATGTCDIAAYAIGRWK